MNRKIPKVFKKLKLLSFSVMPAIKCEHCSIVIPDINRGWNRAGHHWCSKKCFEEDHGYASQGNPIPIEREPV